MVLAKGIFFYSTFFFCFSASRYQTSANQNTSDSNRQFTLSSLHSTTFPSPLLLLLHLPLLLYPKVDAVLSYPAVNQDSGWSTLESQQSCFDWLAKCIPLLLTPCSPDLQANATHFPKKKSLLNKLVRYVYCVGKPPCLLIKLK